ncbi:hypothetical protein R1sor_006154 [Riccia sorocarpa]|uniref:Uncharacterized protein n=1 Tax=Riccia sorocarpa TaxID=122646 RepID=A0ABD3HM88_9MARC
MQLSCPVIRWILPSGRELCIDVRLLVRNQSDSFLEAQEIMVFRFLCQHPVLDGTLATERSISSANPGTKFTYSIGPRIGEDSPSRSEPPEFLTPSLQRITVCRLSGDIRHPKMGTGPQSPMPSSVMSNLANLLPTGSYLAFQTLAPLFTNNGHCAETERIMTAILILIFAVLVFILSFTDSITTEGGKVYYGIVTCRGLFNPHFGGISLTHPIPGLDSYFYTGDPGSTKYILNGFDIINGILVVITFSSLSMLSGSIADCYYPNIPPTIVKCAPILVALVVGMYFAFAPPARNGVGFAVILGKNEVVREFHDPRFFKSKDLKGKPGLLSKGDSKDTSSSNPNSSPSPHQSPSPRLIRPTV